jgi:methionine aminopeptidase type I
VTHQPACPKRRTCTRARRPLASARLAFGESELFHDSMLLIRRAVLDAMLAHARSTHPLISCGIVAGPTGSDRPERFIPMQNADRSSTSWSFDAVEQYRVWREMDARDEEPVVVYYSQDQPDASPSRTTILHASEAQAHYMVISTAQLRQPLIRSFRIADGKAAEEEISIIDAAPPTTPRHVTDADEGEPLRDGDPRRVGPFTILGTIGAGGMGRVYLGRSPSGLLAAIKMMRPELADEPGLRRRFAREVSAARRVSGAFTASVIDASTDGAVPWMATQYVQGPSLQRLVELGGPLPVPSVARLGAGIAEALRAIHAAGLVHRDLKPGNVLVTGEGPKVIDFGISRADGQTLTQHGTAGTPAFMAPEQITAPDRVGPAADVFALGSVLVFAATGHGPFTGGDAWSVMHRISTGKPDLSKVPGDLRAVVTACLKPKAAARPTPERIILELADRVPYGEWLPPAARAVLARTPSAPRRAQAGPTHAPEPFIIDDTPPGIVKPAYVGLRGAPARTATRVQSADVVKRMRQTGRMAAQVLDELSHEVRAGVTTGHLDDIARTLAYRLGAYPSMLGYNGYPRSTCTSVNDVLTNGLPGGRRLDDGDIVGVSLGLYFEGVHAKVARTYAVGQTDEASGLLIAHAQVALTRAIRAIAPGRQVNVIGRAIEATARRGGYGVVRDFGGHGLGTEPFNDLFIKNYDSPDDSELLESGQTFTIHPILTLGKADHTMDNDDWTVHTKDGRRSAEAMHTVLVTETGPAILTEGSPR